MKTYDFPFYLLVPSVLFGVLIAFALVDIIVDWKASFFFRMYRKVYQKFYGVKHLPKSEIKKLNVIYECTNCERYVRKYQLTLYEKRHNTTACPHCKADIANMDNRHVNMSVKLQMKSKIYARMLKVHNPEEWMLVLPDCPPMNRKELANIQKTIDEIKRLDEYQVQISRQEEYMKKGPSNWIDNTYKTEE